MKLSKKLFALICFVSLTLMLFGCFSITEIDYIKFETQPKLVYNQNDDIPEFDIAVSVDNIEKIYTISYSISSGVVVKTGGVPLNISTSGFAFSGFNTSLLGTYTAVIKFSKDGGSATISFTYEVVEETFEPLFAGGTGTENNPYLITNRQHMQNISLKFNDEKPSFYKVANGISAIDGSSWTPVNLYGSFDGNNVRIENLSDNLFLYVKGDETKSVLLSNVNSAGNSIKKYTDTCVIKNILIFANISKAKAFQTCLVRNTWYNTLIENVQIDGYIEGTSYTSSFISFSYNNMTYSLGTHGDSINDGYYPINITFKNCISSASLVSTGSTAGGFTSHLMAQSNYTTINLIDSAFNGKITSTVETNATSYFDAMYNPFVKINQNYSENFYHNHIKLSENNYLYHNAPTTHGESILNAKPYYSNPGESIKLISFTINIPTQYGLITFDKLNGAYKAIAVLSISPNPGSMTGNYMHEEIIFSEDSTATTTKIKKFDIAINVGEVSEKIYGNSGLSADGNTYIVIHTGFAGHNGASVSIIQYDIHGNVLGVGTVGIQLPSA